MRRDIVFLVGNFFLIVVLCGGIYMISRYWFADDYFIQSYVLEPVYAMQSDMVNTYIGYIKDVVSSAMFLAGILALAASFLWFVLGMVRGADTPGAVSSYFLYWWLFAVLGLAGLCGVFFVLVYPEATIRSSSYFYIGGALFTLYWIPYHVGTMVFSPVAASSEVPLSGILRRDFARR